MVRNALAIANRRVQHDQVIGGLACAGTSVTEPRWPTTLEHALDSLEHEEDLPGA